MELVQFEQEKARLEKIDEKEVTVLNRPPFVLREIDFITILMSLSL